MIPSKGLYQWTRVPFGLCSAPSSFQKIIRDMLDGCVVSKNLLDYIVFVRLDDAAHDRKLDAVLHRLSEHRLTITYEKAEFGVDELHLIGFTVSMDGVRPLESKVASLQDIPHSFLSTANYYLKFVPNFAVIAEPLRGLIRNDLNWNWISECNTAFDAINSEIASSPALAHVDANLKTIVSTDPSAIALGAVLSLLHDMRNAPSNSHPVPYIGREGLLRCRTRSAAVHMGM